MEIGSLTRYNASAGSGKTYKLTGVYLDFLFKQSNSYRKILAVTFTNKAAAEMKDRIIGSLYSLATGRDSAYLEHLVINTGKSRKIIEREARENLEAILHDYSRFSVGTIDSFFQKILRSFARESGLHAGFNLVLDPSQVLSEAVDELLSEADSDPVLLKWLTEYTYSEVQAGKHWNLKRKIEELGGEIFSENYRLLSEAEKIIQGKEVLIKVVPELLAEKSAIVKKINNLANEGLIILERYGITDDLLYQKSKGIGKFLRDASKSMPEKLSSSILVASSEGRFTTLKTIPASLTSAIIDGLEKIVVEIVGYYQLNIEHYKSIQLILDNLYTLGLLTDISEKVRKILGEKNKFLLSDAGDVLRRIIGKDQAPFIYEKAGTRYSNFMIDEFQDTSRIQWDNFSPLIKNSIAEGENNLVVGDIKQAIYRWRNSDWRIFSNLEREFLSEQFISESLTENWRSSTNIIKFNNFLFSKIPYAIEENLLFEKDRVAGLYSEVVQKVPKLSPSGLVRIKRVDASDENHQDDIVLNQLPHLIEEIEDAGYSPDDIGILVRTNIEGQKVIEAIMNYASSVGTEKTDRYSYQIISQDSLSLNTSPAVKLIVSALRYIVDSEDSLVKASMVHFYAQTQNIENRPTLIYSEESGDSDLSLPHDYSDFLQSIRFLPLFEITDRIISYFKLTENQPGIPYITTFQDLVLELSGSEANDIPQFLEWWNIEGVKKSVSSPEQPGAMQLMTIHKSKGLQFKVVILPFLSWTFTHGKNPIIWVQSENEPFNKLGALPVPFKQAISETYFKSYYEEERTQAAIDRLNMLYVAMTRARECMFGFVPVGLEKRHCGRYILDAIGEGKSDDEFEGIPSGTWDIEGKEFSYGSFPDKKDNEQLKKADSIDIPYKVELNDSRLRLKLHSEDYIYDEEGSTADRINYGLLMHKLFESVTYEDEIQPGLENLFVTGRISGEQKDTLLSKISIALKNTTVKSWFNDFVEIRNEAGILLKGGVLKRPDRVIIRADSVTIVDFKFGLEEKGYSRQLKEYKAILELMGYKQVKAFLWFVELEKIVEV